MKTYANLKSDEFLKKYKEDSNGVILDVRTPLEYDKGHLPDAINIPFTEKDKLLQLEKNKSYYVHCRVGSRSASAALFLSQNGFESVFNLDEELEKLISDLKLDIQV